MPEILVISGKGGTGKTTITASFACLAKDAVLVDCDVEAANLHLLLDPKPVKRYPFYGGSKAQIDTMTCVQCNKCQSVCRFQAISHYKVSPLLCEGCAVCSYVCPVEAIQMVQNRSGYYVESTTSLGPMVHAQLGVAQENSGKLVTKVKQLARKVTTRTGYDLRLVDGPPGIGCPVISALVGVDLALIVGEPSLSSIHDARRVFSLAQKMKVPVAVCINKSDLNPHQTTLFTNYCKEQGIPLVGTIPFSRSLMEAVVLRKPVVQYDPKCAASVAISLVWQNAWQLTMDACYQGSP